jgi:hypothetical protein
MKNRSIANEYWRFIKHEKKYWMTPVLILVAVHSLRDYTTPAQPRTEQCQSGNISPTISLIAGN